MKTLIAFLLLTSFSSFAQEARYTITDAVCGEIDPFEIGDACVLQVKRTGQRLGVVIDLEVVGSFSGPEELKGREATLRHLDLRPLSRGQRAAIGSLIPSGIKVYLAPAEEIVIH